MKSLRSSGDCFAVMVALVTVVAGCSRSAPQANVKVSGKILDARGRPVPGLNIRFFPIENVERFRVDKFTINYPLAIGNKDGTFALSMNGGDVVGAPPGKYRVILTGFSKEQNRIIPAKYQDMGNSPLEVRIPNHDVRDLILMLE